MHLRIVEANKLGLSLFHCTAVTQQLRCLASALPAQEWTVHPETLEHICVSWNEGRLCLSLIIHGSSTMFVRPNS